MGNAKMVRKSSLLDKPTIKEKTQELERERDEVEHLRKRLAPKNSNVHDKRERERNRSMTMLVVGFKATHT